MANATVALNFLQESVQQYGFTYVSSAEGTGFAVTRETVYLISAVTIAAITAIGCCCTRWCSKQPIHIHQMLMPPVQKKTASWSGSVREGVRWIQDALFLYKAIKTGKDLFKKNA